MMRADDALKYAAALVYRGIDWTSDAIGGSGCDREGHEIEVDELLGLRDSVRELAALFGDINKYHDGRLVRSYIQIEYGLTTERIWHPDPAQDAVTRWDGHLLHDPGTPCPGKYVVTCDPDGQCVDVRVIRAVAS